MHSTRSLITFLSLIAFLATTFFISTSFAEDEDELEEAFYFEVKPAIISNFLSQRLRFVRADVAIKVRGEDTLLAVEENVPLIKHHLIMLLSSQSEEEIDTPESKNTLQEAALEILLEKFAEEGQPDHIEEVLFTSFLVE